MKKIILLLLLFFNLIPCINKGKLRFSGPTATFAQYGNEYGQNGFTIIDGGLFPDEGTDVQDGNLCVAKTMEYIGHYYDMDVNQYDITTNWADRNNITLNSIVIGGLPFVDSESFIASVFDYNILSDSYDIIGAIDNGHPVMGFTWARPWGIV